MAARRQFLNDPETLVAQALEGFERANSDLVRWNREPSFVVRADDDPRPRVAIVSGGGSGHEPLHTGFVGRGMLDAAVPGGIFASPSMIQVKAATDAVDRGLGAVHVVKNYTGDVINFGLARDLAIEEGLAVETVIVDDDLATDGSDGGPGRRGTAAVIAVEKICGAAAEAGADLARVVALGQRVAAGSRSLAIALAACTHPGAPGPSFELGEGEVEFGVGIHGERGIDRRAFAPARELADAMSPATDALASAAGQSRGLRDDLVAAASAAREGADATAGLIARRGRASYVGELSRGVPDPGAEAVAMFFEAASRSPAARSAAG